MLRATIKGGKAADGGTSDRGKSGVLLYHGPRMSTKDDDSFQGGGPGEEWGGWDVIGAVAIAGASGGNEWVR